MGLWQKIIACQEEYLKLLKSCSCYMCRLQKSIAIKIYNRVAVVF
uniref:Uncharacterized protein n=1 Tax=Anguilla anguilla TaxID=7936 RepID=A0A0E9PBV0_ANGAN